MLVLRYSPPTQSFAPGVNSSWVFQLRLRGRSEVPIDEWAAKVVRIVAGDYCQVAGLDLAVVREVLSQQFSVPTYLVESSCLDESNGDILVLSKTGGTVMVSLHDGCIAIRDDEQCDARGSGSYNNIWFGEQ
jgi:hypothetical protein